MSAYRLAIEPLGHGNWPLWQRRMQDLLMKEGLWVAVKPVDGHPQLGALEQGKALGLLRLHIEDSVRDTLEDELSASEVWIHLETKHKQLAVVQQQQLRREWSSFKQRNAESVTALVARLRRAAAALRASGKEVDDQEEVQTLLAALSETYSQVRTAYLVSPYLGNSVEQLMPVLLAREQQLREEDMRATAFFTAEQRRQQQRGVGVPRRGGWAGRGGRAGRTAGQACAPGIAPEAATSGQPGTDGQWRPVQCYNCGQVGHYSDLCPCQAVANLAAASALEHEEDFFCFTAIYEPETAGYAMAAEMESSHLGLGGLEEGSWLVDSGATHHATPHRHLFEELYPVSSRSITTANGIGLEVRGVGTVVLKAASGATIKLEHVLWAPRLTHSLFSMSRACARERELRATTADWTSTCLVGACCCEQSASEVSSH